MHIKHSFLPLTLLALLLLWEYSNHPSDDVAATVAESFDDYPFSPQGKVIVEHPLTNLAPGAGLEGSTALKVNYEGYERGSRRVVRSPTIPPAESYKLSFWIRFCENFDFGRGGKLHGLGPAKPVTGGNAITPDGWSARLMFRQGGGLQSYVYHQDQVGRFGDTKVAAGFAFKPGRYHHISMQVLLNRPATASNGLLRIWVDDALVIEHNRLRFRAHESQQSEIQRFLFNTFHGGSNADWAPRNVDGSYKTDCAYIDNITLSSNFNH